MMEDPLLMLESQLNGFRMHLEIGDDCVPAMRVNFGTAQPAASFGCELGMPTDSAPIAITHPIKTTEDIYSVTKPSINSGIYPKLEHFTEIFMKNIPEGMFVQHPDIQSAFNTAHLVRGNDILMNFYDDPDAVHHLLNIITDFMLDLTPYLKNMIKDPFEGWFFDWGAMWKGHARISNCSTHMISPDTYKEFILEKDIRFLEGINGGRRHYCGTHAKIINHFVNNKCISGLDVDVLYHDVWSIKDIAPKELILLHDFKLNSEMGNKIMNGELPEKRNLVLRTTVDSIEEGKAVYNKFKEIYQR